MITIADCREIWPDKPEVAEAVSGMIARRWRGAKVYLPAGPQKRTHRYAQEAGANIRFLADLRETVAGAGGGEADAEAFFGRFGGSYLLF